MKSSSEYGFPISLSSMLSYIAPDKMQIFWFSIFQIFPIWRKHFSSENMFFENINIYNFVSKEKPIKIS